MSRKVSRVLRGLAVGIIAVGLLIGFGERRAAAQTYDFTFNYDSGYFTGTFITQESFADPSQDQYVVTGITGATLNNNSNLTYYVVSTNAAYGHPTSLIYQGSSIGNQGGYYIDNQGIDFNTSATPTATEQFNLFTDSSGVSLVDGNGYVISNNTLTFGSPQASTPAPVPGAGWLSYIALLLAAIWFRGRRVFTLARTFVSGFA